MQLVASLKSFIDLASLSLRNTLTLTFASGLFLFVNEELAMTLGIAQFRQEFRSWIAVMFILSLSLSASKIALQIGDYFLRHLNYWRNIRIGTQKLANLTSQEKAILRGFLHKNTKTQTLGMESGVVHGLEVAMILYRSSRVATQWAGPGYGIDYNILDWAWNYLKKNPNLLKD